MVACDRIEKRVEILLPKLEIPGNTKTHRIHAWFFVRPGGQ